MRTLVLALVVLVIVSLAVLPAFAQAPAGSTDSVILCNEVALRVRVPAGGMSVQQRINTVYQRIVQAWVTQPITAANVTARQQAGTWAIYAGNTLIITVQQEDARANRTTTAALAQAWLQRLRDLLPRCKPGP